MDATLDLCLCVRAYVCVFVCVFICVCLCLCVCVRSGVVCIINVS